MGEQWRPTLREARQRLGLSQAALARRASLSAETVRAYEEGRRHPRIESLKALLEALKIDRGRRNEILLAAGFAPDGLALRPSYNLDYTLDEAIVEIETYDWPAFLMNEMHEVLAANRVAQKLWGVDLRHEFADPVERNMLSVASNPRFADRCANWDEAVGVLVAGFKSHTRGPEDIEAASPYFEAVLQRFLAGDQAYVRRFLDLWERTPQREIKLRWSYRVHWDDPEVGQMRFHCFASSASEADGLAFNDWIPLDAATWQALEALMQAGPPPPAIR